MKAYNFEQYSPEWWQARIGLPTASSASKIITPTGKYSASAKGLINELIAETIIGGPEEEPYENFWMRRGKEMESEARAKFEFDHDAEITPVGFITDDDDTMGCSPDGLIGEDCGWEVKCPKGSTHVAYVLDGGLPNEYKQQVHMSMAISGLRKWWFMSYHPNMEPLYVLVEWDEYTDKVAAALEKFMGEYNEAFEKFNDIQEAK